MKRWFDTHKATLLAVVLIIVGVTFTFWYRDNRIDSCRDRGGVPSVSDWWVDPMDIRCSLP